MTPEFSGKQFGWQAARRAAIFLLLMFGVPLALYGLDRSQGNDVSLNEAIRITTATFIGFYLYLIFILSMVRPSWRRMKSLRLPGYWGLIVPLLLFADIPYFIATRPDDSLGSSISTFGGRVPFYLLAALCVVLAMIFARPPLSGERYSQRFGLVGKTAVSLAVLILVVVGFHVGMANWMRIVIRTLDSEDAPSQLFIQLTKNFYWVYVANPYLCGLFSALVAWCAVISRRSGRRHDV